jgi:hypothetical protein
MLDVYLLDYRAIPDEWDRTFDGVIASGSIEHFVRPDDAAGGNRMIFIVTFSPRYIG